MKHVFQTSGSLSLYLNTKSSKTPAPSTFEASWNSAALLRALANRNAAVLTSYSSPCCPDVPRRLWNSGIAPGLRVGADAS